MTFAAIRMIASRTVRASLGHQSRATLRENSGTQTVEEGTDAIVKLATIGKDGPTGTFQDREGSSIIPGATNIAICGNGFVGHFQTMYDPKIYLLMHGALVAPVPAS